jgi:hypothetical protein
MRTTETVAGNNAGWTCSMTVIERLNRVREMRYLTTWRCDNVKMAPDPLANIPHGVLRRLEDSQKYHRTVQTSLRARRQTAHQTSRQGMRYFPSGVASHRWNSSSSRMRACFLSAAGVSSSPWPSRSGGDARARACKSNSPTPPGQVHQHHVQ